MNMKMNQEEVDVKNGKRPLQGDQSYLERERVLDNGPATYLYVSFDGANTSGHDPFLCFNVLIFIG